MASRIATAWNFDTDSENRFPGEIPLLEDMAEDASGVRDIQPRKTLRNRQYGPQPLMLRPEYRGDFLENRGLPILDGPPEKKTADSLLDFSDHEEMLKYLPESQPRDLTDEFYDINRPGEGAGYDDLKHYHDRSWDEDDAPEVSEDKIMRMRDWGNGKKVIFKPTKPSVFHAAAERVANAFLRETDEFRAKSVVAKFLMKVLPSDFEIDLQQVRVAKMLRDLEKSQIWTKAKGWRNTDKYGGVSVHLNEAKSLLSPPSSNNIIVGPPYICTFRTTSGKEVYNTIIQFIPRKDIDDPNKLHVRANCTCNSWLYWGAQYNAVTQDYHTGEIRIKFTPPNKRDPYRKFLVCKHVLACIPIVAKYKIGFAPKKTIERLRRPPRIEVDLSGVKEEIKIPQELKSQIKRPEIKEIVKKWDRMLPTEREDFIMGLDRPEAVAFMAHRFPETATEYVVTKLKDQALTKGPLKATFRVLAKKYLAGII